MGTRSFCWLTLLITCAACTGEGTVDLEQPALSRCRDEWNGILPMQPMPGNAPRVLRWHDGNLFYADVYVGSRFVTLPDEGGTPTEVTKDVGPGLWIEGEALLFTHFDRVYSAPLSGGASMLLHDGQAFGEEVIKRVNVNFYDQELDASGLYWLLHSYDGPMWTVWRMPRDGGRSEQLATLPESFGYPSALIALPDRVMIAGNDGDSYLVPKDGGEVEELSVSAQRDGVMWSRFMGTAPSGMIWAVAPRGGSPGDIRYDLVLARADGKLEEIWPDMPPDFEPDHVWSDGSGGWLIAGQETFSDDEPHTSIWSVDSDERSRRLACDPRFGRATGYAIAAAISGDAAHFVVEYFAPNRDAFDDEAEATGWKLIRVER